MVSRDRTARRKGCGGGVRLRGGGVAKVVWRRETGMEVVVVRCGWCGGEGRERGEDKEVGVVGEVPRAAQA